MGRAYVLGVDASLTGTGVARIWRDGAVTVSHFGRAGRRNESLTERLERIQSIDADVASVLYGDVETDGQLVLAAVESPSHGSTGGSAWDRAALWWRLVDTIGPGRVGTVPPATRAKWATGSGRGDKGAVGAAVGRLWSDDVPVDCADCADALALAAMAAQYLHWDVPTLQRHRDVLAAITWWPVAVPPVIPDATPVPGGVLLPGDTRPITRERP